MLRDIKKFIKFRIKGDYTASNALEVQMLSRLGSIKQDHYARTFGKSLLESDMYVIGRKQQRQNFQSPNYTFSKKPEDGKVVYAFTSEEAMNWFLDINGFIEQDFFRIKGSELFEKVAGHFTILLNTGFSFAKTFTTFDIKEFLEMKTRLGASEINRQTDHIMAPGLESSAFISFLRTFLMQENNLNNIHFGLIDEKDTLIAHLIVMEFPPRLAIIDKTSVMKRLALSLRQWNTNDLSYSKIVETSYQPSYQSLIAEKILISII